MIDCFIVGANEKSIEEQIAQARTQPSAAEYSRYLNLSYIVHEGKPYQPLDLVNHFLTPMNGAQSKKLNSTDFIQTAILYLGSYLHREGFTFDYVNLYREEKDEFKEKLSNNRILTIAITTTLYTSPEPIFEIIEFVKKYNSQAKIVVGGPFVHYMHRTLHPLMVKSFLAQSAIDFLVISSEGELALTNILGALKNNQPLDSINNIAYKDGDAVRMTPIVE
ncbi:MAG: PhpK family radical SAM P-methyltransferase, partial [Chitinivibrionales bacterium]|nr:PhpK family radical SAM P-methyltransferase [Chitinivibrionales bacterium]MBD3356794.1 PhpK family radical SAM P-methyltransferase [Chitinivibrionales bacterium]